MDGLLAYHWERVAERRARARGRRLCIGVCLSSPNRSFVGVLRCPAKFGRRDDRTGLIFAVWCLFTSGVFDWHILYSTVEAKPS